MNQNRISTSLVMIKHNQKPKDFHEPGSMQEPDVLGKNYAFKSWKEKVKYLLSSLLFENICFEF
jgi:hypothetical protein